MSEFRSRIVEDGHYLSSAKPSGIRHWVAASAFGLLALTILGFPASARANCANPTAPEGMIIYNIDYKTMQFCEGTNWISMSGGAGATDTLSGLSCSSGQIAKYNGSAWACAADSSAATPSGGAGYVQFSDGTNLTHDETASGQFFWDATNHRLGIGTATPAQALDVEGNITTDMVIMKPESGWAAPVGGSGLWTTDGTNVWRIGGNVGIGTVSPGSLLEVASSGYAQFSKTFAGAPTGADCDAAAEAGRVTYDTTGNIWYVCEGAGGWVNASAAGALGDGDKGDITVSGSGATWTVDSGAITAAKIATDALDFTEFKDALALDASTDIALDGTEVLSVTNAGTGIGLRVNDDGTTTDTTPFVIDAAGNVGIGTTNPTSNLHVVTSSAPNLQPTMSIVNTSTTTNTSYGLSVRGGGGSGSTGYEFQTLDESGNVDFFVRGDGKVGIGTASPGDLLEIAGSVLINTNNARLRLQRLGANYIDFNDANTLAFRSISPTDTNATVRMVITSGGDILMGKTAADTTNGGVYVEAGSVLGYGRINVIKGAGSTGTTPALQFYYNGTGIGNVTNTTSGTAFNTTSDRRLKENIERSQRGLSSLMKIEVNDYNFIADTAKVRSQGFIAQDLNEVYPEAVTKGDDGQTVREEWSVDYGRVTPLIVRAIQDLKADNDNLRTVVEAQGREIEALKAGR